VRSAAGTNKVGLQEGNWTLPLSGNKLRNTFHVFRRVRKIAKKKAIVSLVIPVFLYGTTILPLDEFSLNLVFEYFFRKSANEIQVPLKSDKNNVRLLYMKTDICTFVIISS
jgi:hypothetical protein